MSLLSRWFDIRPGEVRTFALSFFSAFSVLSFLVLGRSLREAIYITRFEVTSLPYVMVAVAILGLPAVGAFSRMLARWRPDQVYCYYIVILAGGVLVLWPLVGASDVAIVAFYLWTAVGALLLASGLWMVVSEHFTIRQAKRLFGLIGGGGTLGAMLMGTSLVWLTAQFGTAGSVPVLVAVLGILFLLQISLPAPKSSSGKPADDERDLSFREGVALVWQSSHVRNIALIVLAATLGSTLIAFQFIELSSNRFTTSEQLASFLGVFYGWTGGISLFVQVVLVSRLLTFAGVTISLSALPTILLAGSAALLVQPSLVLATLVRGADASLRKSLHRSVVEYLWVPVPGLLRRRTKTFIDTVVDSWAEGLGATIIFLWVTLGGLPSRFLSVFVIGAALLFFVLARAMGRQYQQTILDELHASEDLVEEQELVGTYFGGRDLLTATLTRFDIQQALAESGIVLDAPSQGAQEKPEAPPTTTIERISSSHPSVVDLALEECDDWNESHIPALIRLLARGGFYERAVRILHSLGDPALQQLIDMLQDEDADFVIRRRTPRILSEVEDARSDEALLIALSAGRFEVRFRSAIALANRRRDGLPSAPGDWQAIVWRAIDAEVSRDRPIWELQKLLDGTEAGVDDFVEQRIGVRGELSLEHTFRLLSLVIDPAPVRMAYHGIILDDEKLKSVSLEYLEQVLPPDIRKKLWPFIGDVSTHQRDRSIRSVTEVVDDLSKTGATLFGAPGDRERLRAALDDTKDDVEKPE